MQIKSLRLLSYRSWRIDDKRYSEEIKARLGKLNAMEKLKSEGCSEQLSLEVLGISRATYYRWKSRYRQRGALGLESQSRRQPTWGQELEREILALRKRFPLWGKLKLTELIRRELEKSVAVSTVGRILTQLKNQGKIKPVSYFYGRTRQRRARSFHGHSQRWRYGMKGKM